MRIDEVMARLNVSRWKVEKMLRDGDLDFRRLGRDGKRMVTRQSVESFIEGK